MTNNTLNKIAITTVGIALSFSTFSVKEAQAAVFYLNGNSASNTSYNLSQNGIKLKVTGSSNAGQSIVYKSPVGMGILSSKTDTSAQIDGSGLIETLWLEFDRKVSLIKAGFTSVGTNDDLKLLVDGNHLVTGQIPGGNSTDTGSSVVNFANSSPNNQGYKFGFTVKEANDDYSVYKVEVTPVPEPASVLGLLAVLGAGTTLKRQKNS